MRGHDARSRPLAVTNEGASVASDHDPMNATAKYAAYSMLMKFTRGAHVERGRRPCQESERCLRA